MTATVASENIQLHTVERGDVAVVVNAIGSIEANEVLQLSLVTPGRIRDVLTEEGDYVLAGDILVEQVNDVQRISYEQAQVALDLANLQLQDLLQPVDEKDVQVAEANVRSAWGAVQSAQNVVSSEDQQAAQLRVNQAQAAYDEAVRQRTTAQGGQADEQYALLDARVGETSFNLDLAQRQLAALGTANRGQVGAAYARALQAEAELERVKAGPRQADIDRAQLAVRQAELKLDEASTAYNRLRLTAPFDGVVSRVYIEEGSLVGPGVPVVELTNISPLHVRAEVDEVDIRQIQTGMPARVRLDALPNTRLQGTIDQIALLGRDKNGIVSYDVKVRLDDSDLRVRHGMTAEAAVAVEERHDVLVVPNLFVRLDRRNDQAFVDVYKDDGTLEEVEVKLGLQGQDNSEVVSGLQDGDVIALDLSGGTFSLFGG
ncbi:MAG: efflux RND transporter periplasmic adaptor subunit [Anaerolineae bacterium]|nr:efflux RND transporter periplasmic adaptor subunit [Anaerolineae bacterium]